MNKKSLILRQMLESDKILVTPGCYDCLSAKILEHMGFPAIYLTGYGAEASKLGLPDLGFMTMVEMVDLARNISNSVDVPVISDIDTGYGGVLNITRTIQAFEQAGISAVHMEDQALPKKCSLMDGRKIIKAEEMVLKIKSAIEARTDPNFVIIARSDAKQITSFEDLLRRLELYLNAGADLVMPAGEDISLKEYERLGSEFRGKIAMAVGSLNKPDNNLPSEEYERMGIKIAIHPTAALGAAAKSIETINRPLLEKGHIPIQNLIDNTMDLDKINGILSLEKYDSITSRFTWNE